MPDVQSQFGEIQFGFCIDFLQKVIAVSARKQALKQKEKGRSIQQKGRNRNAETESSAQKQNAEGEDKINATKQTV